jgi:UDP-N-acetylmuramyl pentapeptide phosphotransferase/UDP-N-acetylglucosamine-1-phosphate transferase
MNELKKYLGINSLFSLLSGTAMLIFSKGLNAFFNIENAYVFPVLGLNLLTFSAIVWYVSRKQLSNKLLVNIISGLDGLWVVGSLAIIAFGLFDLSQNGNILIGMVAAWIGFLGYKQFQNNQNNL